jgi:hypothetical protein
VHAIQKQTMVITASLVISMLLLLMDAHYVLQAGI